MAIDLDLCIGCNACVTACHAENNVPMVGKEQVAHGPRHALAARRPLLCRRGRRPADLFQPMPCMHCEQAPCEMGCPVNATVHSPDGLNLQVYNRCIGTRTCSATAPTRCAASTGSTTPSERSRPSCTPQRNPNVTVRDRGVMEKCTYCIQRISARRSTAKIENRPIREGEVRTACQQACPTDAIVFGDIADTKSAVARQGRARAITRCSRRPNTRPRTTYLARDRARTEARWRAIRAPLPRDESLASHRRGGAIPLRFPARRLVDRAVLGAFAAVAVPASRSAWLFCARRRRLGQQHPGRLGLRRSRTTSGGSASATPGR